MATVNIIPDYPGLVWDRELNRSLIIPEYGLFQEQAGVNNKSPFPAYHRNEPRKFHYVRR